MGVYSTNLSSSWLRVDRTAESEREGYQRERRRQPKGPNLEGSGLSVLCAGGDSNPHDRKITRT